MKLLFSSPSAPEAGLLKSQLDEAGIPSEFRNEYMYSNFPGAAFQPEIWIVNDQDYERACEVRERSWLQGGEVAVSQQPSAEKQGKGSTIVWVSSTSLLCLILTVLLLTRFAQTGERRPLAGAIVLGLLSAMLGWAAVGMWRIRRRGQSS